MRLPPTYLTAMRSIGLLSLSALCASIAVKSAAQAQGASDAAIVRLGHTYSAVIESIEDCKYRPEQVPRSRVEQLVKLLSTQQKQLFDKAVYEESVAVIFVPPESQQECQAQLRALDAALAAVPH